MRAKPKAKDVLAKAKARVKQKAKERKEVDFEEPEDRFPAADIARKGSMGKENIKRIPAKEIDPKKCRPWAYHNRNLAWLNPKKCADLIHSITQNGQQEPGLVRALKGDPDYDYEVIYGVRRWYSCSQIPNQKFLAKVTDADDKQCMILMHVENADSQDITEFERACSFAKQVEEGFFKNNTELAKVLGLSRGHISKLIGAASIMDYSELNKLFVDRIDISCKKAYELSTLMQSSAYMKKINERAKKLALEIKKGVEVSTSRLFKELIGQHDSNQKGIILVEKDKKPIIQIKKHTNGKIVLTFESTAKNLDKALIKDKMMELVDEHL